MRPLLSYAFVCAFALLLFCGALRAQRYADSVKQITAGNTPGVTRFTALNEFAERIFIPAPDSALAIWLRMDKELTALIDSAPSASKRDLQVIHSAVLSNIGYYYTEKYIAKPALDYNYRSFALREQIDDKRGVAESLNNLAFLHVRQRDTLKAMEYYERSAEGYRAVQDTGGWAYTMINRANIQSERKEYAAARVLFTGAADMLRAKPEFERGYAGAVGGLATVSLKTGNVQEAIGQAREALTIRERIGETRTIAATYTQLAQCYVQLGRNDSAKYYAERAYKMSVADRYFSSASSAALVISGILEKEGKKAEAFEYFKKYVGYRDSVTSEQALKDLLTFQLSYEYAKLHAADSVRNADEQKMKDLEIATQNEKIEGDRQKKLYLGAGIIVLLLSAATLFNRILIIRKQKSIIESQKKLVEDKQRDILDSMEYATRIQNALLAGSDLLSSKFRDHFIFYRPRDIVSGDFYWATAHDGSGKFYMAVCDSTGHGVPGAFMSLLNISFLNEAVSEKRIAAPGQIFDHVRARLTDALSEDGADMGSTDGMDGVICAFSHAMDEVEFCCANNPLLILRNVDGTMQVIESPLDKMPVSKHEGDETAFTTHRQKLYKDDLLLLFTDGYADQFGGEKGKRLMYRRMKEIVLSVADKDCESILQHLAASFDSWKGSNEQVDDVLVTGIRI